MCCFLGHVLCHVRWQKKVMEEQSAPQLVGMLQGLQGEFGAV